MEKIGLRKTQKEEAVAPESLEVLRKKYSSEQGWAKFEANKNMGKLSEVTKKRLIEAEQKIIDVTPDELEKAVMRHFSKFGYNLEEILECQDEGDWSKSIKMAVGEIVRWADKKLDGDKILISGKDTVNWLLDMAKKEGDDDVIMKVARGLQEATQNKVVCGKSLDELGATETDMKYFNTFVLIPLIGTSDLTPKFRLMAEMAANMPGGDEWVRKEITKVKLPESKKPAL